MKKHCNAVLLALVLVGLPMLQFCSLQAQDEQVDKLFAAWSGTQSPGAAVAVVKNGAIIYKNAYGMANLEYDIPVSTTSIFHIASVSKQFTVFSILLLQSEGKLNLNDDIRKYIPEVPEFGETITLRHLASHTSGLRDQWALLSMAGWRMDDVITKEHILKLLSKQKDLNFLPGDEFMYCNTGFTLLAEVVARVSGKSFAEFTKANIFEPLQMNHTLFYDDHEKIVKNRTYSYYLDWTGYKKSVLNYANVGATSLFSTVEDLSLWALNFSEIKIGNAEIVRTMNTPAVLNSGEEFEGALGQFVGKYKGLNEISHGGGDAGFRSYLTRFPDQEFSVMVLSNSANINAGGIAHQIVDIYLKEHIEAELKEAELKEGEEKTKDIDEPFDKTSVNLSDFTGLFYSDELSTAYEFKVQGDKLVAQHSRLKDINLLPFKKDAFSGRAWFFSQIDFIRDSENAVTGCKVSSSRVKNLYFKKID